MDIDKIEDFLRKKGIDTEERVERVNGGQYLKNLLKEFATEVSDDTLTEVVKETRNKISWIDATHYADENQH